MQTHPIHVRHGRELVLEVRSELFAFSEVLDVFITGRDDVLVVVCEGRPRPAEWVRALRCAGYEILGRRHARSSTRWSVLKTETLDGIDAYRAAELPLDAVSADAR